MPAQTFRVKVISHIFVVKGVQDNRSILRILYISTN